MDLTHFHPWFIGAFTTNYYIIEFIYYIYKIRSDLETSDDFGAFWRYLEIFGASTRDDHRAGPSVDTGGGISIDVNT